MLKCCFLLLSVAMLGCDREAARPAASSSGLKSNCVVCGDHELDVTAETLFTDYNGARYYFCSDYCKSEFAKDPATYAAKQAARKSATKPATSSN